MLVPYVNNKDLYTCPSLPKANWDSQKNAYGPGAANEWPSTVGYGLNELMDHKPLAQMQSPANTIAIVETRYYPPGDKRYVANWGWYFAYQPDPAIVDASTKRTWSELLTAERHLHGNDVVFADGHAKWMRWDVITSPSALPMWNGTASG
jgi:prepilin-type processing-associated H-X9-DG protein